MLAALPILLLWPAASPTIDLYPDSVRFDLTDGHRLADPSSPVVGEKGFRFGRPLRLAAAREEVIAFQIVGRGVAGDYPISVEGLDGLVVETFEEIGIDIPTPTESAGVVSIGPGRYPDPLVPTSTLTVPPPPAIGAVWVDVFVPQPTEPGPRRGVLVVGTERIDLEITVLDVKLPADDIARLGSVNFGSLLDKERADPKHMLRWMQMGHAHRVDIEIMRTTPEQKDGVIDWDGWMKRVAPYVEGTAFTKEHGYVGPRAGLPVVRWVMPHTDWWPTKRTEAGLPDDPERWSKTLAEWERRVEAAGWFGRPRPTQWIMFINSLDEPKKLEELESLAKYEALIEAAGLKDRRRVWFRVDGNFGPDYGGLSHEDVAVKIGGAVDLWNLHGASNTAPIRMLDRRRNPLRERAMFYASNSGGEPSIPPLVIDADVVGARAWAWLVYRYDLFGALNWEVDYYKGGCIENPKCSEGGRMNLDANLIYRGEELGRAEHEPIASIRLKMLRRGAQDVAIAAVLAARRPEISRRIAEILVPRALGDGVPDAGRGLWTLDPAAYDRARNALLTELAGGTTIPVSSIRTDGKAAPRPTVGSYVYGLCIVALVAVAWWWLSRGARNRA